MISVIMPTMWKGKHYKKMLPILDKHPLIGEIIIIDNDIKNADSDLLGDLKKINYLKSEKNLFVNPSWNYGAKNALYDKLCFYSDDVLFNIECLELVFKKISSSDGLVGFSETSIFSSFESVYFSDWEPKQISVIENVHHRYGTVMFLDKESFVEIPENLKVWYGDTFLFLENKKKGKTNWQIENFYAVTKIGTTSSSPEFNVIKEEDTSHWRIIKNNYKNI